MGVWVALVSSVDVSDAARQVDLVLKQFGGVVQYSEPTVETQRH